jgi:hypothetical protein
MPAHPITNERLPPVVVQMLRARMQRHATQADGLLRATLLLDRCTVQRLAQEIAEEPRLSRPSAAAPELLNTQLPSRFFDLQDQLYDTAKSLANFAAAGDDDAMARTYGQLAGTCVSCHAVYMRSARTEP